MSDDSTHDVFTKLADEIRALNSKIELLEDLVKHLTTPAFTELEISSTQDQIDSLKSMRSKKKQVLEDKINVYETKVLGLEKILQTRKDIIENKQDTNSLRENPELLKIFVDEHARMTKDLRDAQEFLLTTGEE